MFPSVFYAVDCAIVHGAFRPGCITVRFAVGVIFIIEQHLVGNQCSSFDYLLSLLRNTHDAP